MSDNIVKTEMLDCPFCGATPDDEHKPDCYFQFYDGELGELTHDDILVMWNTRPRENALLEEIEMYHNTLADNEEYGLSVIRERDALRAEVETLRAAAYELSIAVIQYGMDMTDGKWKFVKRANTDLRAALKWEGG